ncbi:hypothetical protein ACHAWF_013752 [Thalassiosira exigua]
MAAALALWGNKKDLSIWTVDPENRGVYIFKRDNQSGPNAAIKSIHSVDLGDLDAVEEGSDIKKRLVLNLIDVLKSTGGQMYEKLECMAMLGGEVWIMNNNNATDDNSDETIFSAVNIDSEGIAVDPAGGFWVASEGRRAVSDENRPIKCLNFVSKLDEAGVIKQVVTLPDKVDSIQLRFGFEGVAVDCDYVMVAF